MKHSLIAILIAAAMPLLAQAATVSVTPAVVLQGDPLMVTVSGTSTAGIRSGAIAHSPLYFFAYDGSPAALYGVDINQKTGTTTATVVFKDGTRASASFLIVPRARPIESLPIPAQLGGNSVANQQAVVSVLATENADLASIYSRTDKALWTASGTDPFLWPVASTTGNPRIVTDPYGYARDSGAETITHKGTDFRAPPGTPVYAITSGVVRVAKAYVVYGNSVIVDHGDGLLSMYMHLSKMSVSPGQAVQKGQLVGYSGETGYSEGPHLHLTIRIGGVSIDPMAFYALFREK